MNSEQVFASVNYCLNPNAPNDTLVDGYDDNSYLVNNLCKIICAPKGGFMWGAESFDVGDYILLNDKNTATILNPKFQSLTESDYAKSNADISLDSYMPTRLYQKFFSHHGVGSDFHKIDPTTSIQTSDYFNCFIHKMSIRVCIKKEHIKNYL